MGRLSNTAKTATGPFRSKRAVMLRKRSWRSSSRPFKAAVAVSLVGATLVSFAGVQGATEGVAGAATSTTIVSGLQGGFGLAVDASGNRYVTETNSNTVSKISPSGTKTTIGSGWNWPVGVAVNSAGDVFVAGGNDRVVKVSADGTRTTIGVFNGPGALTFDAAGNLFVANMTDVVEFPAVPDSGISADGNTGWKVVESGDIYGADGVAVAPNGTVYVSNYYYQRIDVLTPDGSGGYTRSEEGTSLGNWYPTGMSTDAAGNLYVTSPAKNAVYRFAPDGTYASIVSGFQSYGVVVDAAGGSMYLTDGGLNGADYNSDRIIRVTGLLTPTTPTISNLPTSVTVGGSFTPTVTTTGDGTKSVTVTSSSSGVCTVSATGIVSFLTHGTCTLTPSVAASTDYSALVGTPLSFVVQLTPALHWTKPKPFTYGTPLSPLQLDAGASVLGIFVYSSPNGTVLSAGSHTMTATFHPLDSTNYASVSISTSMIVKVASSTTTLALSSAAIAFSAEAAETFTVSSHTSTGVPNSGPVNVTAGKVLQCVAVLDSTGTGTCSLNATELRPGRYAVKATTIGNNNVKGSLSASQLLTVTG